MSEPSGGLAPDGQPEIQPEIQPERPPELQPEGRREPERQAWERDPVPPEWEDASSDPLAEALREALREDLGGVGDARDATDAADAADVRDTGDIIESARTLAGDLTLGIRRDAVAAVAACLKERHAFTCLVDLCGADYPQREPRFEVVYHLYSFAANRRVRLKVRTDESTPVPTVSTVWRGANWLEREVWDMFGVRFEGHPDMTRILLWEGFNGHPLRKDFPVEGIDTGAALYPEDHEP